jgi:hypothetical protein
MNIKLPRSLYTFLYGTKALHCRRRVHYVTFQSHSFFLRSMDILNASLMREGRYVTSEHNTVWFINLLLRVCPHCEANGAETGGRAFCSAGR